MKMPHEILISDGGSTDKTLEIARRYTQKIVVWDKPGRQMFGQAKNAGAALAHGDYFVFIDADVIIPDPDAFFKTALEFFEQTPGLVAITAPLRPMPDNKRISDRLLSGPLNWWYVISNNLFNYGNASGEFQMMTADAFKKVGGYQEHLAAGEDNNMFYRLSRIGKTRSYRKLKVHHSLRRVRKLGWLKIYLLWIHNGIWVMFFHHAGVKEWEVIR